jgi:hypothetical protein
VFGAGDRQRRISGLAGRELLAAALIPAFAGTGSDQPESQMFEYSPDHLAVIYRTDDPHSTLTFRTDQGIDLPGLRRDRLQSFESVLPSFS